MQDLAEELLANTRTAKQSSAFREESAQLSAKSDKSSYQPSAFSTHLPSIIRNSQFITGSGPWTLNSGPFTIHHLPFILDFGPWITHHLRSLSPFVTRRA